MGSGSAQNLDIRRHKIGVKRHSVCRELVKKPCDAAVVSEFDLTQEKLDFEVTTKYAHVESPVKQYILESNRRTKSPQHVNRVLASGRAKVQFTV